jgi:hypothetical protein
VKSSIEFRRIKIQRKTLTEIGAEQRIYEWITGLTATEPITFEGKLSVILHLP